MMRMITSTVPQKSLDRFAQSQILKRLNGLPFGLFMSEPISFSTLSFKQMVEQILRTQSMSRQERYALRYWLLRKLDEHEQQLVYTLQRGLYTGEIKIID